MYSYLGNNKFRNILRRIAMEFIIFIRFLTWKKLYNYLLNLFELKRKSVFLSSLPSRVYIETTNNCNLRCPFCVNISRPQNKKGNMTMDNFASILKELSNSLISVRLYNQGEPLVDKHLLERLHKLHECRVNAVIVSNFSVKVPKGYFKELVASRPAHIVICFESLDNDAYQKYRVGGNIETVIENIRRLVLAKKAARSIFPLISLRVFITRHNEHALKDIYSYYTKSGANNLLFVPMYVNLADTQAVADWLPLNKRYRFTPPSDINQIFCEELWNNPVINYQGLVMPCCLVFDYTQNFGGGGFKRVWNSGQYQAARAYFSSKTIPPGSEENICLKCRGKLKMYTSEWNTEA